MTPSYYPGYYQGPQMNPIQYNQSYMNGRQMANVPYNYGTQTSPAVLPRCDCLQVTSTDEVKSMQADDFIGYPVFYYNQAKNELYRKQLLNTGAATIYVYALQEPIPTEVNEQSTQNIPDMSNYITKDEFMSMQQELIKKMTPNAEQTTKQSYADTAIGGSQNGFNIATSQSTTVRDAPKQSSIPTSITDDTRKKF